MKIRYVKITNIADKDIPCLVYVHNLPEISRFISISENFWNYVTSTENVFYYKVYDGSELAGSLQLELSGDTLYMSILVFPEHQKKGIGTAVVKDVQNDVFGLGFKRIEVSVDVSNHASLKLFEKYGFEETSRDGELLNLMYVTDRSGEV